jgi:hypothetical protein
MIAEFRDADAIFEQRRGATNPVTVVEAAGLADHFPTRFEENATTYRRVVGRLSISFAVSSFVALD